MGSETDNRLLTWPRESLFEYATIGSGYTDPNSQDAVEILDSLPKELQREEIRSLGVQISDYVAKVTPKRWWDFIAKENGQQVEAEFFRHLGFYALTSRDYQTAGSVAAELKSFPSLNYKFIGFTIARSVKRLKSIGEAQGA